jgi:hypothetical protein
MSERDDKHYGLWLWVIVTLILTILVIIRSEVNNDGIRDLQRRVGQLEEGIKQ